MKTLFLTATLILSSFAFSQDNGATITVTIDNVKNNNGKVSFALHTKDTFMKARGIMETETKTFEDNKVTVTFKNVTPGEYAILALHDENENNRMDFNENGMPKESYGMSNNPVLFGPPQFSEAKFEVKDNMTLNIRF